MLIAEQIIIKNKIPMKDRTQPSWISTIAARWWLVLVDSITLAHWFFFFSKDTSISQYITIIARKKINVPTYGIRTFSQTFFLFPIKSNSIFFIRSKIVWKQKFSKMVFLITKNSIFLIWFQYLPTKFFL